MKEIFYDFGGYNVIIFRFLNHVGNIGFAPYLLGWISDLFKIWSFAIYYILLCIYQYYRIKRMSPQRREKPYEEAFYSLTQIGICYAVFGFVYAILKFSVNMPRPYCSLTIESFITIVQTNGERCLSSFPSAHTGIALMMTIFAWPYFSIPARFVAVCVVTLVAFSRIVLAMHYPSDIVYSLFITVISIGASRLIFAVFCDNLIRNVCDKTKRFVI